MNIIVAVDKNWAIGNNNSLLVSIPEDMKYFKDHTIGKVVVMGRKTLESFPGSKPLKQRENIVLSSDKNYNPSGVIAAHSMEELDDILSKYNSEDIYIIGGESIYRQFLDKCDVAHITRINYSYQADAYFPNLDEKKEWVITQSSDEHTYFDLEYVFLKYEKKVK